MTTRPLVPYLLASGTLLIYAQPPQQGSNGPPPSSQVIYPPPPSPQVIYPPPPSPQVIYPPPPSPQWINANPIYNNPKPGDVYDANGGVYQNTGVSGGYRGSNSPGYSYPNSPSLTYGGGLLGGGGGGQQCCRCDRCNGRNGNVPGYAPPGNPLTYAQPPSSTSTGGLNNFLNCGLLGCGQFNNLLGGGIGSGNNGGGIFSGITGLIGGGGGNNNNNYYNAGSGGGNIPSNFLNCGLLGCRSAGASSGGGGIFSGITSIFGR